MKDFSILIASFVLFFEVANARDVPQGLRNFYNHVKGQKSCDNLLQGGFYDLDGGPKNFGYCQDNSTQVLYLHGSNFELANMDVDCDGVQGGAGEDGRCGSSLDTQSQTTFKSTIQSYKVGLTDLNAKVHPYVVFGNDGTNPSFNPQKYGVLPLSVIAVVCGDKLVYGIWGDTNGNDGKPLVGEAAISLATECFGAQNIKGNQGHDQEDVLYIAFPGSDAVPGAHGANWTAQSFADFESSIQSRGDSLVARFQTTYPSSTTTPPSSTTSAIPSSSKTGAGSVATPAGLFGALAAALVFL